MENFYKTLYCSQISEDTFNDSAPLFLNCNNIKRLDGEQQKTCEGLITEAAEFYLCCWDYVSIPLKDCLNDAYQRGEMSISQRRGVISLLPKKNKDTLLLKKIGDPLPC